MPRVPRVPGRSIKLNPLPDTTQKLNVPAAAFGGPDLTPRMRGGARRHPRRLGASQGPNHPNTAMPGLSPCIIAWAS
jgi:hypothetical protein